MLHKDKDLDIQDWGIIGYHKGLLRQEKAAESRLHGTVVDQLILTEHHSVITIGRSAIPSDFKLSKEELNRRRIATIESIRGGKLTFHGPGQLVV